MTYPSDTYGKTRILSKASTEEVLEKVWEVQQGLMTMILGTKGVQSKAQTGLYSLWNFYEGVYVDTVNDHPTK